MKWNNKKNFVTLGKNLFSIEEEYSYDDDDDEKRVMSELIITFNIHTQRHNKNAIEKIKKEILAKK